MNATRSFAARRSMIKLGAAERHGMSWSQKLLTRRRREDVRTASVHLRLQPEPHAELAGVSADAQPAERFRGAGPGSIGGRDHGGPGPAGREETILECPSGGNSRAIAGGLHGRTGGVIQPASLNIPAVMPWRRGLALILWLAAISPAAAQQLTEPFTPSARWSHYVHRTYSPARMGFLAVDTAVDHVLREPACWDFTASSYGRRYRPGLRAPRGQEQRRTRHRSPDRRGLAVSQVAIVVVSRKTLERGAKLRDGADARWIETPRVHPLFRQRTRQRVHGKLDPAADSTGALSAALSGRPPWTRHRPTCWMNSVPTCAESASASGREFVIADG